MEKIDELIQKFWQGKTSKQEEQELLDWLNSHEVQWQQDLKAEFMERLDKPAPKRLQRLGRVLGMAAALLLVGTMAFYFLNGLYVPATPHKKALAVIKVIKKINASKENIGFYLPDSSLVSLSPSAALTYAPGFTGHNRHVSLVGEARFNVTANAESPFTVKTNGYTTTALGTDFEVRSAVNGQVSVRLISGKVVVRSGPGSAFAMKDVYLLPGQRLRISGSERTLQLDVPDEPLSRKLPGRKPPLKKQVSKPLPSYMEFDKAPLTRVFSSLATRFNRRISYEGVNLDGLTFTGRFEPGDSLEVILAVICQMNELSYNEVHGKIQIVDKF